MIGLNTLTLIGNVGSSDLTFTQTGIAKLRFTVAVGSKWKDKLNGTTKTKVQWFTCILWGTRGEALSKYIDKGQPVTVVGPHESHDYQDRDGVKRVAWAVNVQELLLLPGGKRRDDGATAGDAVADEPALEVTVEGFAGGSDDDIPF